MASDSMPDAPAARKGDSVQLSLNFSDPAEQQRVWDRLAAGGQVTMPLKDEFFGRFGMLTDRFGTCWMLHYDSPDSKYAAPQK
jgi:PhnB protein